MQKGLEELFQENEGLLKTKQLEDNGIYYRKRQKLIENGEIEMVRRGYYQMTVQSNFSDVPLIISMFPDAIFCMDSALQCYGYTEHTPTEWHIAVSDRSSRKKFRIDYPFIQPHFIIDEKLNIGVTEGMIDDCKVRIYDRERTICDILLHKNKMDAEVYNFAIQSYIHDEKKDISRLIPYARKLRVEKKVREILGIWL